MFKMKPNHVDQLHKLLDAYYKTACTELDCNIQQVTNIMAMNPKIKDAKVSTYWYYYSNAMRQDDFKLQKELYEYLNDDNIASVLKYWYAETVRKEIDHEQTMS